MGPDRAGPWETFDLDSERDGSQWRAFDLDSERDGSHWRVRWESLEQRSDII